MDGPPPDLGPPAVGYDSDFHAWALAQGALLRAGRLSEIDIENLAEEIESLGRSVRKELVSRLQVLLLHLLKWRFQPERQGRSWELTINDQRREIRSLLKENPSLKSRIDQAVLDAYERAVSRAELETHLIRDMFPWSCPFTFEQMMDEAFWPEAA